MKNPCLGPRHPYTLTRDPAGSHRSTVLGYVLQGRATLWSLRGRSSGPRPKPFQSTIPVVTEPPVTHFPSGFRGAPGPDESHPLPETGVPSGGPCPTISDEVRGTVSRHSPLAGPHLSTLLSSPRTRHYLPHPHTDDDTGGDGPPGTSPFGPSLSSGQQGRDDVVEGPSCTHGNPC